MASGGFPRRIAFPVEHHRFGLVRLGQVVIVTVARPALGTAKAAVGLGAYNSRLPANGDPTVRTHSFLIHGPQALPLGYLSILAVDH